jgi:small subunit ribosomal protein S17
MSNEITEQPGHRKIRTGMVVSNKMDKTIVVRVERLVKHPLIKKYIRRHKKYYAHDAENTCGMGDTVRIEECRPLSKLKRWNLLEVIERAK